MRKHNITNFIGKQLSRLKLGQTYYSIIMSTFTALGILTLAFRSVSTFIFITFFVIILISTFFIGYYMDVSNISALDHVKSVNISSRFIDVADYKNNEFRILMMETMFEWFKSLQEGKPIDKNILDEKYKEFLKKWSPPKI